MKDNEIPVRVDQVKGGDEIRRADERKFHRVSFARPIGEDLTMVVIPGRDNLLWGNARTVYKKMG
jgi:hypothetical protein